VRAIAVGLAKFVNAGGLRVGDALENSVRMLPPQDDQLVSQGNELKLE